MKVLIIGNGGREHALAWKISKSKKVDKIFMAKGNAGTDSFCTNIDIEPTDIKSLVNFSKKEKIDLTIVGPEDPLCMGIVDEFEKMILKFLDQIKSVQNLKNQKNSPKIS